MKIAITGHTAGIGQAFAKILADRGHEIVGLSKRYGDNIRNTPKIVEKIIPCDLFINNAQAGYAQTELLYAVWDAWQDQPAKHIWNISTMMTQSPTTGEHETLSVVSINAYRNQKVALEDAHKQLSSKAFLPKMILVRPGAVATQSWQTAPWPAANCDTWCQAVIDYITYADQHQLHISEISLLAGRTPVGI
jgi:nucleoside-diphosphate-sugar epimerase